MTSAGPPSPFGGDAWGGTAAVAARFPRWLVALPPAWTFLSCMLWLALEWLFLITKPSFLSGLTLGAQVRILLAGSTACALPAAVACGIALPALAFPAGARAGTILMRFALAPAAAAGATMLLMLADNFTYTIFGLGVLTVGRAGRLAYALAFALLLAWTWRSLARSLARHGAATRRSALGVLTALILLGAALTAASGLGGTDGGTATDTAVHAPRRRPNILVMIGDGIEAGRVSLLGYERDTTPFLRSIAATSLVAENCVAGSAQTFTSTAMLLTGRLPTASRMIFTDILQGDDAYRHLPAILRSLGYRSLDVSIRHYADPFDMNMRHSFDRANYRDAPERLIGDRVAGAIGQQSAFLLQEVLTRAADRIGYAVLGTRPDDAFREATQQMDFSRSDAERLSELHAFLSRPSPEPFFAYLHLQGTHGPRPAPRQRVFSVAAPGAEDPPTEGLYDDAVLEFDAQVRDTVAWLRARGLDERTLLVVLSDHGREHRDNQRVPLLMRFPEGANAGRRRENVQLIDVAPTILDYLGVPQPAWMDGVSLLAAARDPLRPVFGAGPAMRPSRRGTKPPPYFGMRWVSVALCDRSFKLDLDSGRIDTADIPGHTAPCAPSPDLARRAEALLRSRLHEDRYPYPVTLIDLPAAPSRD